MATANRRAPHSTGPRRSGWFWIVAVVLAALAFAGWWYRGPILAYSDTGASYGAQTACACRYIAKRGLKDCERDFDPGMEIVFVSENPAAQTVTARVPLLARETARYVEGWGCVLEKWDRQEP